MIMRPRVRHLLPYGLCVAVLCAASAVTVMAAPFELPPLVQPATSDHHVGKVIWVELVTPDLAAAKTFYSGLFGWTFQDIHGDKADYAAAFLDGRPVGGIFQRTVPSGKHRQPAWLTFIAVTDVDAAKKAALGHGAKVVFDARSFPQRGRQAVLADPQGAVFAVLASSSGDPADVLAEPGEWIWTSLQTKNPDTDAGFYQTLFGYDVFDVPSDDGKEHVILSSDDYARASVNPYPADSSHRHPHWLNFVRVEDATAAAAKVVALGGRVLVEPQLDRHGGHLAIVADPAGAFFGLMEWSDTDTKKEPK